MTRRKIRLFLLCGCISFICTCSEKCSTFGQQQSQKGGNEPWQRCAISRGGFFQALLSLSSSIVGSTLVTYSPWIWNESDCFIVWEKLRDLETPHQEREREPDLDAPNFRGCEQHFDLGKGFSQGWCFVISRRVVLQLFIMQHVLCADIRAATLAPRFSLAFEKHTFGA